MTNTLKLRDQKQFHLRRFRDDGGGLVGASCALPQNPPQGRRLPVAPAVESLLASDSLSVPRLAFPASPHDLPLTGAVATDSPLDQRFALIVVDRPAKVTSKRAMPDTAAMLDVSGDPAAFDEIVERLSRKAVAYNAMQRARCIHDRRIEGWIVVLVDGVPGASKELQVGIARVAVPATWWPASALSLPPCTSARGLDPMIAHTRRMQTNAATVKAAAGHWLAVVRECGTEHLPSGAAA